MVNPLQDYLDIKQQQSFLESSACLLNAEIEAIVAAIGSELAYFCPSGVIRVSKQTMKGLSSPIHLKVACFLSQRIARTVSHLFGD
jgi:hypothetical protein